jgi:hypothetical protein
MDLASPTMKIKPTNLFKPNDLQPVKELLSEIQAHITEFEEDHKDQLESVAKAQEVNKIVKKLGEFKRKANMIMEGSKEWPTEDWSKWTDDRLAEEVLELADHKIGLQPLDRAKMIEILLSEKEKATIVLGTLSDDEIEMAEKLNKTFAITQS